MQEFDRKKFEELILLIARECEGHTLFGATKLNKILFFCDFTSFAELGEAITGAEYVALEHGPAPRVLVQVRNEMTKKGDIILERQGNQERVIARRKANWGLFPPGEQFVILDVIRKLENESADSVSELSHKFPGWQAAWAEHKATGRNPTIPYQSIFVSNQRPSVEEIAEVVSEAKAHGWSLP
jgi:hypothetical protein